MIRRRTPQRLLPGLIPARPPLRKAKAAIGPFKIFNHGKGYMVTRDGVNVFEAATLGDAYDGCEARMKGQP